jgi:hypothetical protein
MVSFLRAFLHNTIIDFEIAFDSVLEFLSLLKAQQREATLRIKELLEYPILCLPNQHAKVLNMCNRC